MQGEPLEQKFVAAEAAGLVVIDLVSTAGE
jgi:hypothetical protein